MWRSIGSVKSIDDKSNRSKQESAYEPFTQTSRLRLNESQLSGKSEKFLPNFLSQKRSAEEKLMKSKSAKKIYFNLNSNEQSEVNIIRSKGVLLGQEDEKQLSFEQRLQDNQIQMQIESDLVRGKPRVLPSQVYSLQEQLGKIKGVQGKMRVNFNAQIQTFKQSLQKVQAQCLQKISQTLNEISKQNQPQPSKHPQFNPEILEKIKNEGAKFNHRITQIQDRKKALLEKYNKKHSK